MALIRTYLRIAVVFFSANETSALAVSAPQCPKFARICNDGSIAKLKGDGTCDLVCPEDSTKPGELCPKLPDMMCQPGETSVINIVNGCPLQSCVKSGSATSTRTETRTDTSSLTATHTSILTSTKTTTTNTPPSDQANTFCQTASLNAMASLLHLEEGKKDLSLIEYKTLFKQLQRAKDLGSNCSPKDLGSDFLHQSDASKLGDDLEKRLGVKREEIPSYVNQLAKNTGASSPQTALAGLILRVPDEEMQKNLTETLSELEKDDLQQPENSPSSQTAQTLSKPASGQSSFGAGSGLIFSETNGARRQPIPSTPTPTKVTSPAIDLKLGASEQEQEEISQLRRMMTNLEKSKSSQRNSSHEKEPEATLFERIRRCTREFHQKFPLTGSKTSSR